MNTNQTGYKILSGIVKDTFVDPHESFSLKTELGHQNYDKYSKIVDNPFHLRIMTKNSIIAYIIDENSARNGFKPVVCIPFFSSHISMPINPGEHVWIISETFDSRNNYYWLSRKHAIRQVEDLNYTHLERQKKIQLEIEKQLKDGKKIESNENLSDFYHFNSISSEESNLPENENFDNILKDSISFNNINLESVLPAKKQHTSDIMLQGSNNTLIHLSVEKFKKQEEDTVSSSIDIVVGRKPNNESLDLNITNKRKEAYQDLQYEEYNKTKDMLKTSGYDPETEKDIDPKFCDSRIYLSKNCSIDDIFNIEISKFSKQGGSAVATYSDHNRMYANKSLLLVNNFSDAGASYIGIKEDGKIQIGSKNEDIPSFGGTTGLQPFVRGDDLEDVLHQFMDFTRDQFNTIATALSTVVSPFFAIPIAQLNTAGVEALGRNSSIDTLIKPNTPKFKSKLIEGE